MRSLFVTELGGGGQTQEPSSGASLQGLAASSRPASKSSPHFITCGRIESTLPNILSSPPRPARQSEFRRFVLPAFQRWRASVPGRRGRRHKELQGVGIRGLDPGKILSTISLHYRRRGRYPEPFSLGTLHADALTIATDFHTAILLRPLRFVILLLLRRGDERNIGCGCMSSEDK